MRLRTVIGVGYLALQVLVPLSRMRTDRPLLMSGRFSWTMFSGRALIYCSQKVDYRSRRGAEVVPFPLPKSGDPSREILAARSNREVGLAWYTTISYADNLTEIATAMHSAMKAYKGVVDPENENELSDDVTCAWPKIQEPYVGKIKL